MAMYTQVDTLKALVGLNALEYIAQSFVSTTCHVVSPLLTVDLRRTVQRRSVRPARSLLSVLCLTLFLHSYGACPEFFESSIRGSAVGMLSTFGRLSGIVAPFAARPYIDGNSSGVLWLACGGIWLAAFALLFLPVETRGKPTY